MENLGSSMGYSVNEDSSITRIVLYDKKKEYYDINGKVLINVLSSYYTKKNHFDYVEILYTNEFTLI